MTLKGLCSWLNATLPGLGKLIRFEVFVVVYKKAFPIGSQVVLEEIDDVEKPAEVDILLISATKNRLPSGGIICLVLR